MSVAMARSCQLINKYMMKNTISILSVLLSFALLTGCTNSQPQRIEITSKPASRPTIILPTPDVLNLREVEWFLITPENFEEKIDEIQKQGRPVVFFAITDQGYENLSLNLSDLRSFIEQQKTIIAAYENYYSTDSE